VERPALAGLFAGQRLSLTVASSSGGKKKSSKNPHSSKQSPTLARAQSPRPRIEPARAVRRARPSFC